MKKFNHGSDFAAYFAKATKAKKASSFAKATADKTADQTAVKKATIGRKAAKGRSTQHYLCHTIEVLSE